MFTHTIAGWALRTTSGTSLVATIPRTRTQAVADREVIFALDPLPSATDLSPQHMFNPFHGMPPTDAELATQTLVEEGSYRFASFSANDAVTLGLSIRKRFRGSTRHSKGKGLVISIQTTAGHTLFSCTVGDLGHVSGIGDVSTDSWACLEGMISVVKRTGHSSFYVEKGMSAMGKTPKQLGMQGEFRVNGGAFPIWLENAPCCPIAVVACYSGSSQEDHTLVSTTIRDFINKVGKSSNLPGPSMPMPTVPPRRRASTEWTANPHGGHEYMRRTDSPFDHHDDN